MSDAAKEKRQGSHKALLAENQTHKRRERAQELSSKRREGILAKRRRLVDQSAQQPEGEGQSWSQEEVQAVVAKVLSSSAGTVLGPLSELRQVLSLEDPPIQEVVEAGLAPKLVELLAEPSDEIKIEATWCISNIASGDSHQTQHVVGSAPNLIAFLSANNPVLQEHALFALGNMAGDCASYREMLHANGTLLPASRLLQAPPTPAVARTAAWAVCNLARGSATPAKPFLDAGVLPPLMAALAAGASGGNVDAGLVVEAAWTLAFLLAKEDMPMDTVLGAGGASTLVQLLARSGGEDPLCTPVLRALGNVVSSTRDECVGAVMDQPQFLPALNAILTSLPAHPPAPNTVQKSEHRALIKEAAWVASNVAAARAVDRKQVAGSGVLGSLLGLLGCGQFDLQKEAAFAVWNLVSTPDGAARLTEILKTPGVVDAYVGMLRVPDADAVRCAMSFVRLVCDKVPGGAHLVERHRGLEAIDDLHYGPVHPELSAAAATIVDQFFGDDYEGQGDEEWFQPPPPPQGGGAAAVPTHSMGRGKHLTSPSWMHGAAQQQS